MAFAKLEDYEYADDHDKVRLRQVNTVNMLNRLCLKQPPVVCKRAELKEEVDGALDVTTELVVEQQVNAAVNIMQKTLSKGNRTVYADLREKLNAQRGVAKAVTMETHNQNAVDADFWQFHQNHKSTDPAKNTTLKQTNMAKTSQLSSCEATDTHDVTPEMERALKEYSSLKDEELHLHFEQDSAEEDLELYLDVSGSWGAICDEDLKLHLEGEESSSSLDSWCTQSTGRGF